MRSLRRFLSTVINLLVKKVSRNYIAGPKQIDAQFVSKKLQNLGYCVTQGYWDGVGDTAHSVLKKYLVTLERISSIEGSNYLSIKIPALDFDSKNYKILLDQSQKLKVPLHFDALSPELADKTFQFLENCSSSFFGDIGCTLPSRWKRSLKDVEFVSRLGFNVRVVKGQWEDPDNAILDINKEYLNIIKALAGKASIVRVATHDLALAKNALDILQRSNTPCELELLYGLPINSMVELANDMGVPVRIYIAYGNAYLPYALQSFTKRPSMIFPLIKELFRSDYLSTFPKCKTNEL